MHRAHLKYRTLLQVKTPLHKVLDGVLSWGTELVPEDLGMPLLSCSVPDGPR